MDTKRQKRNASRVARRARARARVRRSGIRAQIMIVGSKAYSQDEIDRFLYGVCDELGLTRKQLTTHSAEVLNSVRADKATRLLHKHGEHGLAGLVQAAAKAYRCNVHPAGVDPLCAIVDGEPGTFILACPLCAGDELRKRWEAEGRELVQSTGCSCFEGAVEGGEHVEKHCENEAAWMIDGDPYCLICEECVAKGYAGDAVVLIPLEPAGDECGAP